MRFMHGKHTHPVICMAFSSHKDVNLLASITTYDDDAIKIWDTVKLVLIAEVHISCVNELYIFSPDGTHLAMRQNHFEVALWKPETDSIGLTVNVCEGTPVLSCSFSSCSQLLAFSYENTVEIWDIPTQTKRYSLEHDDWVTWIRFSPLTNSDVLATRCYDGSMKLLHVGEEICSEEYQIEAPQMEGVMMFSPTGETIACVYNTTRCIKLWCVETGKQYGTIYLDDMPHEMGFFSDGKRMAFITENNVCILTPTESTDLLDQLSKLELE
jgi:WD40 repeat protein